MSDSGPFFRFLRCLPVAAALVAFTGVVIRLIPGRPAPPGEAAAGERTGSAGTPALADAPPRPAPVPAPLRESTRPVPAPPEVQSAALREASLAGAVDEIRSAARRGDRAMIRGLLPGLRRQPDASRRALEAALDSEADPSARAALHDALADLR